MHTPFLHHQPKKLSGWEGALLFVTKNFLVQTFWSLFLTRHNCRSTEASIHMQIQISCLGLAKFGLNLGQTESS